MADANIPPVRDVYVAVTIDAIGFAAATHVAVEAPESRLADLFDAHHQRLYRLARRMTRSQDAARDLVQDTFLRVARSPESVPAGAASEEAWLVRILVNICRDQWRRKARFERAEGAGVIDVSSAPASSHETALVARTTIWDALRKLPPRRRAAIVLYELEDVSMADIAALLGVSTVTVRWHLSVGRKQLSRIIRNEQGHD
jgi:RNA polymerase sigma-70 factor (ECF subfamily)